jgi:23S rRNA U2552 (ribose-2'-O)-methylase RlmE/FtsJ
MTERILFRKISIKSADANNIDNTILITLKQAIEGKCCAEGYVKEIKSIINRTRGNVDVNESSGNILFDVSYKANVISVVKDDIIIGAIVSLKTPAGIFLIKDDYIKIFMPIANVHQDYNVNDVVHVLVLKAECNLQQKKINVIGEEYIYNILSENERLLIFSPNDISNDKLNDKFNYNITDLRSEVKTTCNYGYNDKINELKNMIDNIDSNIWRFYRSLLNPFELVCAPSSYSTFKLNKESIPSRAYYKLWEILYNFSDAFNTGTNVLNLCENPGGFIKAIIDFHPNSSKMKFNLVSIKNDIEPSIDLLKKYKNQVKLTNLNILDPNSLKLLTKEPKANIITADGGIKLPDGEFNEETELGVLKFSEIVIALSCQAIGGTFVVKLFDSCSQLTVDLIYILYQYYTELIIIKPQTSRPASSERYLIAINFKGISKTVLDILHEIYNKKPIYITKLLQKITDKTFINLIRTINQRLQNSQMKKIKEMIEMINFYNGNRPPKDYITRLLGYQEKIALDFNSTYFANAKDKK